MSVYRRVLLLCCCLLAFAGCSTTPSLPSLGPDDVILAFGDSLTRGTGAGPGESYPEVLSRIIGRTVVNAGIPGETSAEGIERLAGVLDEERPALVIICHGGNDFLRHLDPADTERNIRAMVVMARGRNISVVLVAVPEPNLTLSVPSLYQRIADDEQVPLENKALPTIFGKGSLKSDYIHPNAAGYKQMAEAVARLLEKSGALSR